MHLQVSQCPVCNVQMKLLINHHRILSVWKCKYPNGHGVNITVSYDCKVVTFNLEIKNLLSQHCFLMSNFQLGFPFCQLSHLSLHRNILLQFLLLKFQNGCLSFQHVALIFADFGRICEVLKMYGIKLSLSISLCKERITLSLNCKVSVSFSTEIFPLFTMKV